MSDNFIIGSVNKAVSENMRFLRAYEANPQALIDAANKNVQPDQSQQMDSMMQFMMMMIMMQMMGGQNGSGADIFDAFPDYRDLVQTNTGGSNAQTGQSSDDNPASGFLTKEPAEGQSFEDMLKAELDKGSFSRKQLRQALTAQALQTQDPQAAAKAFTAITALIDDHILNPLPFMQEGFLNQLDDGQYSDLLTSASKVGMPLNANGVPQPAFLSHLLTSVNGDEESTAYQFAVQLIKLYGQQHGEANTTQGDQVRHLMALTGIRPEPETPDEAQAATV